MTGLLFGLAAGILLGISDLFAARTAKFVPAVTVARTAFMASTVIAAGLVLFVPSEWTVRDTAISALSGSLLAIALVIVYHGYKVASIGVIAPTSAVLMGLIPVLDGVRRGDQPSALAWAGMALGIVAIGLATYQPGKPGGARLALMLGAGSGTLFGCAFALFDYTSKESGLLPVLVQRLAAGLLLALGLLIDRPPTRRAPWLATRMPARKFGIGAGICAGFAMAAVQLGYRSGQSGPVAVAASQFATVGVLLSVIFEKERLRRIQWIGIAGAAVGVALLALG